MIRIDLTRQNINHPDHRKRHPSRASCEVGGQRYETTGPGLIYKLATLLWLHGHGGEHFEVWDDLDPFGNPGGLALRGPVRNWARIVKGKPKFNKDASSEVDFSPDERKMVEEAAGRVIEPAKTDSPQPDNAHTARSHPLDGPEDQSGPESPSTGVVGARAPKAA